MAPAQISALLRSMSSCLPRIRLSVLAFVPLLSLLWPPIAALAAPPILTLGASASMQAEGLWLTVPVAAGCPPAVPGSPDSPSVHVLVDQVVDERTIAHGLGSAPLTCDDTVHSYQVPVLAQNAPFHEGTAAVRAFLRVCLTPPSQPPSPPRCEQVSAGPQLIELVAGDTGDEETSSSENG